MVLACLAGVFLIPTSEAQAGGGPENVLLVVNADSASSKMLANYYIHLRKIPSRNVVYLNGIPNSEIMSAKDCEKLILKPIAEILQKRKLTTNVDYVVYSSDFPTSIDVKGFANKYKDAAKKALGKEPDGRVYNPNAALTSMTYYMASVLSGSEGFIGLESNNYYRNRAQVLLRQPFVGEQQKKFEAAVKLISSDSETELKASIAALIELGKKNPNQLAVNYWLSKFHGKLGDKKGATNWLIRSIKLGWCYRKQTNADIAFEKVKDDPVFKGIVDRIPNEPYEFTPTQGFKSSYVWGPNGMVNAESGQGNRHLLSSMLAVTRNEGITEKQALDSLKISIAADESNPKGKFYFCDTTDVRTKTRKPNFEVAMDALKKMGFRSKVVKTAMPSKEKDIIGLTCGIASFQWPATGSKIMPGAICDNLTSYGGRFSSLSQTKCTEFLVHGAAGACGTVTEPYALQVKFPHPMIHVHYTRGCSMAESFFQSVHGPFQTILMGDALCQPWANKPKLTVSGVNPGDRVEGQIDLLLDASQSPTSIGRIEFYVDGLLVHRVGMQEKIAFDTSSMADGFHEIRLVAVANDRIESTGHVILPITVDNSGSFTTLETEHADYLITDEITFKSQSTFGDSIELMHNGRAIAKKIGLDATFKVKAKLLGRGPVTLQAVAISESGGEVASTPITLIIEGPLSEIVHGKKVPAKKK